MSAQENLTNSSKTDLRKKHGGTICRGCGNHTQFNQHADHNPTRKIEIKNIPRLDAKQIVESDDPVASFDAILVKAPEFFNFERSNPVTPKSNFCGRCLSLLLFIGCPEALRFVNPRAIKMITNLTQKHYEIIIIYMDNHATKFDPRRKFTLLT